MGNIPGGHNSMFDIMGASHHEPVHTKLMLFSHGRIHCSGAVVEILAAKTV